METYVIALKRDCFLLGVDDWRDRVEQIEGVKITSNKEALAIRVEGPTGIGDKLQKVVGGFCNIEHVVLHDQI
tara:strand:- start:533 stop:751 length:219 start_codon:yes stop_codon:yes gene_type:complete